MNYPTNMMSLICDCRNLLKQKWEVCACSTCTMRQMAVLMLWQSRGLANGTCCLFIVIVPVLFMYHMLGTWLALGKLDSAPKAQMLVMCELNFI